MVRGSEVLYFWYDGQVRPAVVAYNGTKYAYIYSLQGDVLGLIDSSGTEVVGYNYNAWGETLSVTGTLASTLGNFQPFRYRGYIYDYETGLYYLRSRYYNPVWCRFINADSVVKGNLYCYCDNNSVMNTDKNGFETEGVVTYIDEDPLDGYIIGITFKGLLPNTVYHYTNNGGYDFYIWLDENAKPVHSRHYTDHNNRKAHPWVPHDHNWNDKNDGSGNRDQDHTVLPPDDDYSEEGAKQLPPQNKIEYSQIVPAKKSSLIPLDVEIVPILLTLLLQIPSTVFAIP